MKTMTVRELQDAFIYLVNKGYGDLAVFMHHRPTGEDVEIQHVVPDLDAPTAFVKLEEGGSPRGVPEFQVMDRQALEVMQNRSLVPRPAEAACCAAGHDFFYARQETAYLLGGAIEHLIICRRCGEFRKIRLQP